jgi:O-antigen/teichoic acid export membrane protein
VAVVNMLNGHFVFPTLSRALREGPSEAMAVYGRVQRVADWLLCVLGGALMVCGHWAVRLLYDGRYAEAGWMLQCLAVGVVGMRFQVLEQMMFAMSLPSRVTLSNTLRAVALAVLIPIGFTVAGLQGALVAIVLAQYAGWPVAWHFRRSLGVSGMKADMVLPLALAVGLVVGWACDLSLGWLVPLLRH